MSNKRLRPINRVKTNVLPGLHNKKRRTPLCVVGVWFNIVQKNKLTKITSKCIRRQKRKRRKKKQIINILCQQGVESQCSCKIKFTNIYIKKEFIRHIHKSRKHSFTSRELNLVYHPNRCSSSYKKV